MKGLENRGGFTELPLWSPAQSGAAEGIAPVSGGVCSKTVQKRSLSHLAGPGAWNTPVTIWSKSSETHNLIHDKQLKETGSSGVNYLSTVVWFSNSSGFSSWFSDLAAWSLIQVNKVLPCLRASFSSSWFTHKYRREKITIHQITNPSMHV